MKRTVFTLEEAGHSMPAAVIEHFKSRDVNVVVVGAEDEEAGRRRKFMAYKIQHYFIIDSYEQFKSEYLLIKEKKSKLSAKLRKEIEAVWVYLFDNQ
jgi:hypothetical protein